MTPIDIRPVDLETVRRILREHVSTLEVRAFGSRVDWNARETSDLDLVLMTDEPLTVSQMADLRAAFTSAALPFRVDILDWASTSEAFQRVVEAEYAVLVDGSGGHHGDAWPVRSIQDMCLRVTSGGTPSRRRPSFYEDGRWPWLKTQELRDGWLDDSEEHITDDAVASSSAKVLPENTVLMAMYGATVGRLGILRRPMTCNQACCAMIVDPECADYRYLFYQLLHARPQIRNLATGAAQQNLSGRLIKSLKFPFPPLPEQRWIAHILGALDDKIELNRQMNKTLEAMARAIFKDWFVDFGPVRAKLAGRVPYLPPKLWNLFPNRLVDSELGEIPVGWEVKALGEVIDVVGGTTPSTKRADYWEGGTHCWATPKDLSALRSPVIFDTERKITDSGLAKIPSGLLPAGTLLLSSRAPIGYLAICQMSTAINQGFITILPRKTISNYFMLNWSQVFHDEIANHANGSTFLEISKSNFRKIRLVISHEQVLAHFDARVQLLYERIASNERESRALATLRDALLPKLVSGGVRLTRTEGNGG